MKKIPLHGTVIGKIWALPTTVWGILFALAGVCMAPRKVKIRLRHNAICFYNHPFMRKGAIALTIGNVILFQGSGDYFMSINIAEHEKQHTLQAEILGIFYLPLHGIFLLRYFRTPYKNPLERGPYSDPPRPW